MKREALRAMQRCAECLRRTDGATVPPVADGTILAERVRMLELCRQCVLVRAALRR